MNEQLRSILLGTSGLGVAAIVAAILAVTRRAGASIGGEFVRARRFAAVAIALQCVHFAEEWFTGFPVRFPELLGLTPWPPWFFVSFNFVWIIIWCISAAFLQRRPALFAIWFLAIACAVNGVAHPVLAAVAGGYFPGLWTSPLVGLAGVGLLQKLSMWTKGPGADE